MKKIFVFSVLLSLIIFGCSKKIDVIKLEKDTPAYELATELSKKLPSLDPDENRVLVSAKEFKITTGEVVQIIQNNFANRIGQLKNMDANGIKDVIESLSNGLGEQKLFLNAAKNVNIIVPQTEIDSILSLQYQRAGGEEKFMEWLNNYGMSIEEVKNDIQNSLTINHYLDETLAEETEVTDEEIQKLYNEDKTASVRHILLMTQGKSDSAKKEIRKKMEGILEKAKQGEDFAKLAEEHSEDPGSKNNGGLFKDFGRGSMVKPFEDAAFSVPIAEISDIIETRFGYHILKVIDRKKETQPLVKVQPQLERKIKEKKQNEAYIDHVNKLKEESKFKILEF
ncbi:MAG: peptidylprolyl isomerase [Candidatus Marinimicrobia bacterium]|nr:peptidylprolyl isomerase [Candidatus Neomarinimicrobiota bacterium]